MTAELAFLASLIAIGLGVPAGVIASTRQYSKIDQSLSGFSLLGLAIPHFWLATLLILLFSITLQVLPPGGVLPPLLENPSENLRRMAMPAISLGLPSAAIFFRMSRSCMLEVLHSEYIVTAQSKGLSRRRIVLVHALKNAMIPLVTVAGLEVTAMLGGSFIIESIFSLPGMGRATVMAIFQRDYTVLQGSMLVFTLIVVASNLIIDLLYAVMDPRIRYE